MNSLEKADEEQFGWNSPKNSFTCGFMVGKQGHIYLNARINDVTGLFLFDTGCDLSEVNEELVTDEKMKLHRYTVTDAHGIKQSKHLYKVKMFELGAIGIKHLHVYPADTLSWTDPRGIRYEQDSIIGIIGNNIISEFIWDFNLKDQSVTVSNNKKYCRNLPDSLAISLVSENNHKIIPVQINGEQKMLSFDFGCSFPLVLSDSIPNRKTTENHGDFSQDRRSSFNHLDTTAGRKVSFDFVDVEFVTHKYEQIKCFENDQADLLGIPFIWEFERVVLDFNNNKSYFITKNNSAHAFGVNRHNRQSIINASGILQMTSKSSGCAFSYKDKDSNVIKYMFFGSVKIYKNKNGLDRIFYSDSVLLPGGQLKYGPSTLYFKE